MSKDGDELTRSSDAGTHGISGAHDSIYAGDVLLPRFGFKSDGLRIEVVRCMGAEPTVTSYEIWSGENGKVTHGIDHEAYRNIATAHSDFKTLTGYARNHRPKDRMVLVEVTRRVIGAHWPREGEE